MDQLLYKQLSLRIFVFISLENMKFYKAYISFPYEHGFFIKDSALKDMLAFLYCACVIHGDKRKF